MATTHEMGIEELLALPEDGLRHELLDGVLAFALRVGVSGSIDLPAFFAEVLR